MEKPLQIWDPSKLTVIGRLRVMPGLKNLYHAEHQSSARVPMIIFLCYYFCEKICRIWILLFNYLVIVSLSFWFMSYSCIMNKWNISHKAITFEIACFTHENSQLILVSVVDNLVKSTTALILMYIERKWLILPESWLVLPNIFDIE